MYLISDRYPHVIGYVFIDPNVPTRCSSIRYGQYNTLYSCEASF